MYALVNAKFLLTYSKVIIKLLKVISYLNRFTALRSDTMASYEILTPNKNGLPRIMILVEFGYDENGNRLRSRKTFTLHKLTESNIINAITQFERSLGTEPQSFAKPKKHTFKAFSMKFMADYVNIELKVKSRNTYENYQRGYLEVNPCANATKPKRQKSKRINYYTEPQMQQLLSTLPKLHIKHQLQIKIAMYCGLRMSEIVGLRLDSFEFVNNTIYVDRTL